MRKSSLVLSLFFIASIGYSQEWKNEVPKKQNLKFQDIQKAYYGYFENHPEQINKKGNGQKQFKRWEWFWKPRVHPDGTFPAQGEHWYNWQEYLESYPDAGSRSSVDKTWKALGPNKVPKPQEGEGIGRINSVVFHPSDANTFWVCTPAGGLWKTSDNGKTWSTNTDNMPVLGVSDMAIHPTNPDTMWIATGDGDFGNGLSNFGNEAEGDTKSLGIFKSVNGGATWTNVYSTQYKDGTTMRRLLIDKNDPKYLYAATSKGIMATNDGGANWAIVQAGHFIDLEFHPSNTEIMYASTYDVNGGAEIYRTVDGGSVWTSVASDSAADRINLEVTMADTNLVLALASEVNSTAFRGLFASSDEGANWTEFANQGHIGNLLGWETDRSDAGGQGNYDLAFVINPQDEDEFYVGGISTWKTTDAGSNWSIANWWSTDSTPVVHADKHFLTYHPLRNGELYECNDGGIWRTKDGGATWESLCDGLAISQIYDLANSIADSTHVVIGLQDCGSKELKAGTWKDINTGDGVTCAIDDKNKYVYSTYVQGQLDRTDAQGNRITVTNAIGHSGSPKPAWMTPFALDAANTSIIYVAYEEIYKSNDSGDSWSKISNTGSTTPIEYYSVSRISSQVQLIGNRTEILISVDEASSFSDISTGLPLTKANIGSMYCSPLNKNHVYVTLSGFEAGEKVYMSKNQGSTWTNMTATGLPNIPVNTLIEDTASGDLYVGTDVGVFIKEASGTAWKKYGDKLPVVPVTAFAIHAASSKLRAGTYGRGVWEVKLNSTKAPVIKEPTATNFGLNKDNIFRVFPNPGNGIVKVELSTEIDRIGLYNYSGELLNSFDVQGEATELDLTQLPAGVYFLGVKGQQFQEFTRYIKQ